MQTWARNLKQGLAMPSAQQALSTENKNFNNVVERISDAEIR